MTDRPQDVVRKGLEDRDWDCMCDPGSHESPCPFAALSDLITERDRLLLRETLAIDQIADLITERDRLREALERIRDESEVRGTAMEPVVINHTCPDIAYAALSASPPEQESE